MSNGASGDQIDVLLVGAGFAGLYQLYHLRELGLSVRLVDAGSDLGGTWYWNHYPGARVDTHVPNYEFTFAELWREWRWSERFPGWEEIRRYFQHVDNQLHLRQDIRFDTRVTSASFDADLTRWRIRTSCGEEIHARFLVLCTGFAARAYVPECMNPDDFEGECCHTAHWPEAGIDFSGKRVGVIGTGASGIQVIQEVSKEALHLTVFQRTPNYALPMRQHKLDDSDHCELQEILAQLGRRRREEFCNLHDHAPAGPSAKDVSAAEREAVFESAWEKGGFEFWGGTFEDVLTDPESNRHAYDFWRDKTRARIHDPVLARQLAPSDPPHPFGTTRPSLEQDYFEVFNRDNVSLVDTARHPIEKITARGVLCGSDEYELDVIVLATGFDALTGGLTQIDIVGTAGLSLREKWRDGVKNYLGMAVSGFPNMFVIYGPLSPAALCTGPVCAELQGQWIVECLRYLRTNNLRRIEAEEIAEAAWVRHVEEAGAETLFPLAKSWYMGANIPGKPRQFLCYYNLGNYMERCRLSAEAQYEGFAIS